MKLIVYFALISAIFQCMLADQCPDQSCNTITSEEQCERCKNKIGKIRKIWYPGSQICIIQTNASNENDCKNQGNSFKNCNWFIDPVWYHDNGKCWLKSIKQEPRCPKDCDFPKRDATCAACMAGAVANDYEMEFHVPFLAAESSIQCDNSVKAFKNCTGYKEHYYKLSTPFEERCWVGYEWGPS